MRERDNKRIKIEIDTHLFVKWNKQTKLGHFRQNITEKVDAKILQEIMT
jgi:hypothetical protein